MSYEATGTVHSIGETTQISERFSKRDLVVEIADNPKYPQLVQFQATGDRCAQLDEVEAGDTVRIEFSLRGREWRSPKGETRFFNSLDVWKVEVKERERKKSAETQSPSSGGPPPTGDVDDIPF